MIKRRALLKYLSASPLALGLSGIPFLPVTAAPAPPVPKRDLIKELGLSTFINAAGTFTTMTASLMHEEVMETMNTTSKEFVMLDDVQDKVGVKIAALCHAESAMVTAGCWSALVLGTAGVLTGMDQAKVSQLPNVAGLKSEVIVQKAHNVGYVHALTNTGVSIVAVETAEELENAITDKTAMMWFLNFTAPLGKIQHEEWLAIGKKHKIPCMIDMAADVPPVTNLWRFNDLGFDLVCVSGGKAIRGPQSAGLLMGRKDLIAAARLSSPPRAGNIGRGMKVNKEEILGMYVALEMYIKQDHDKDWKDWEARVAVIEKEVSKIKGVSTKVVVPPVANHTPSLVITWDKSLVNITRDALVANLRSGTPSIAVMSNEELMLNLTVFMLKPGQDKIVGKRIAEELAKATV